MAQGISAHGLIITIRPSIADPTVASGWVAGTSYTLTEVGDVSGLGITRNVFDITSHNLNIDSKVMGVPRREEVAFPIFYNRAITTHRMLRTLASNASVTTQMLNGFTFTGNDGEVLIFSGGVKELKLDMPVDGVQMGHAVLVPTGNYILNGIEYGS